MIPPKPLPVDSIENLRQRVDRMFRPALRLSSKRQQLALELSLEIRPEMLIKNPSGSVSEFLDFLTDAVPDGDVNLFGGVLRDLALLGRRGFNSDIDLVVEGDWKDCETYLKSLNAQRNKFGGYRLNGR
jgi:predicted nucleotidyltransferase